ncbi:MAG: hypothetical protein PHZ07_03660 [Patescibacteria group bacterium]|nr:hypothetical protein [Patescibacteria group bacterium]MDD4304460.1 hypothetical protein [Patescibacteria group bacterium]MDD4695482.1 hypothetical protein [Patescibacteria group bacterium]
MERVSKKQFYWPILGHRNVLEYLQSLITNKNFCRTYLFSGPKDIGKKTMADYFMQSIFCEKYNCLDEKDKCFPCGVCVSCIEAKKHIHPDFISIDLEDDKKNISIDSIREFKEKFYLTPIKSIYKVAIINNADHLSDEASNALLKIIEDSPKNSVVIFISENPDFILPTIKSRAEHIIFNSVAKDEIFDHLKNSGLNSDIAKELSEFSAGLPGISIYYSKNLEHWEKYKEDLRNILEIIDNPVNDKFKFIEEQIKLSKTYPNQYIYFDNLLSIYSRFARDLMVYKLNENIDLIHPFLEDVISKISSKYDSIDLLDFYKKIIDSKKMLYQNVNPKIIFENLLLI